jgi:hypothetical protein
MTTAQLADPRYQVLDSGVRIVRLGPGDAGWLREYQAILRSAARDFFKRAHLEGEPDVLLAELEEILSLGGAVWLVVDAQYRLLGFAAGRLHRAAWTERRVAESPCCYLYARKTPKGVFRVLWTAMRQWATEAGATELAYTSRRPMRGLERITGATWVASVYTVPLNPTRPD